MYKMLRETRGNVTKMINIFLKLINLIYLYLEMNLKSLYIYIYTHTHIYIYIYLTESLGCIPETNTTLSINYISINKKGLL